MRKIFKIVLSFLISISCITPFLVQDTEAAVRTLEVPYDEPLADSNHGYISVLFKNNSSGSYFTMTFIWSITNESAKGGNSGMKLSITNNSIEFTSQLPDSESGYSLVYRYNGAGSDITISQYQYFTGSCTPYKYTTSSYTIMGFHAQGNVKNIVDEVTTKEAFSIRWGSESGIAERLTAIENAIKNSSSLDSSILDELENISGDISTVITTLDNINTKLTTTNTHLSNIKNAITDGFTNLNDDIVEKLNDINERLKLTNGYLIDIKNILTDELEYIGERCRLFNVNIIALKDDMNTQFDDLNTFLETKFTDVVTNIQNFKTILMNWLQSNFERLMTQLTYIYSKLHNIVDLLSTEKDSSSNVNEGNNINSDLNENINDFNDIESNFHDSMNDSLNNIDTDLDLLGNNDFIKTATFISTNINRIVTSNAYYNAFVITGLVLGIALVMIGKKVI